MSIRASEGKWIGKSIYDTVVSHIILVTLSFSSVGCKFKGLTLWFQSPVDTVVLLIVPLKPWKLKGWENSVLTGILVYGMGFGWWITFSGYGHFSWRSYNLIERIFGECCLFQRLWVCSLLHAFATESCFIWPQRLDWCGNWDCYWWPWWCSCEYW